MDWDPNVNVDLALDMSSVTLDENRSIAISLFQGTMFPIPKYCHYFFKTKHTSSWLSISKVKFLLEIGAIDYGDLIALLFLMWNNRQMPEMYTNINQHKLTLLHEKFIDMLKLTRNWEKEFFQALVHTRNFRALSLLHISKAEAKYNLIHLNNYNCRTKLVLYRICERISEHNKTLFLREMNNRGAPMPQTSLHFLELYFMFWHHTGFINLETQDGFDHISCSLKKIQQGDVASILGFSDVLIYNVVFDNEYPTEVYEIRDDQNPGLCIVVNQVNYNGLLPARTSSHQDAFNLQLVMKKLNFSVIIVQDLDKEAFCQTITTQINNNYLENYSMFLLVVMGHGTESNILCRRILKKHSSTKYGTSTRSQTFESLQQEEAHHEVTFKNDEYPYLDELSIEEIQNCLFSCEKLVNKPKVLIVNSCRGHNHFIVRPTCQMQVEMAIPIIDCPHIDLITCFTSLSQFVSYRDRQKGSLFINVLCNVLSNRPDMEICELFTYVNNQLMRPSGDLSSEFLPGRPGKKLGLANPIEFNSILTKKLYLKMPASFTKN